MGNSLLTPFTFGDVLASLHGMYPTKTLGPNGFSAIFYQKY